MPGPCCFRARGPWPDTCSEGHHRTHGCWSSLSFWIWVERREETPFTCHGLEEADGQNALGRGNAWNDFRAVMKLIVILGGGHAAARSSAHRIPPSVQAEIWHRRGGVAGGTEAAWGRARPDRSLMRPLEIVGTVAQHHRRACCTSVRSRKTPEGATTPRPQRAVEALVSCRRLLRIGKGPGCADSDAELGAATPRNFVQHAGRGKKSPQGNAPLFDEECHPGSP